MRGERERQRQREERERGVQLPLKEDSLYPNSYEGAHAERCVGEGRVMVGTKTKEGGEGRACVLAAPATGAHPLTPTDTPHP